MKRISEKQIIVKRIRNEFNLKTMASKQDVRNSIRNGSTLQSDSIITTDFVRNYDVDYDVVICIPSKDRYDKVIRILDQIYFEQCNYSFKVILLNDGSDDIRYDEIPNIFENIIYIKNDISNGKIRHWYSYSQMWNEIRNIKCNSVLQMDDDFILCNNFLTRMLNIYYSEKNRNNRILGISPHLWSLKKKSNHEAWWKNKRFVDGIVLLDIEVIKRMNYEMKEISPEQICGIGKSAGTWKQICDTVINMSGQYFKTDVSLVYHDGNNDSKLHADHRIDGNYGMYTQKFIGK